MGDTGEEAARAAGTATAGEPGAGGQAEGEGERRQTVAVAAAKGAAAGAVATVAMSACMLAAQKAGLMGRQPPAHIVRAATGRKVDGPPLSALSIAAHLGFGSATGAVYAVATVTGPRSGTWRRPSADPRTGMAFGLAVWAVSYAGWVPALGILDPPSEDRLGRPTSMAAAHVVYGAVLGRLLSVGRPQSRS